MVDAIVMWGGGIDSAAIVEIEMEASASSFLRLLYVDYGAKARMGEIAAGRYFAGKYPGRVDLQVLSLREVFKSNAIIDAPMTDDHRDDYVPGRNFIIGALAYGIAERVGAKRILFGGQPLPPGDPMIEWARDMQRPFVDLFNGSTAFSYGAQTARMEAPLLAWAHKDLYVRWTLAREPDLFDVTFSCYQSRTLIPCGDCAHCIARAALKQRVMQPDLKQA